MIRIKVCPPLLLLRRVLRICQTLGEGHRRNLGNDLARRRYRTVVEEVRLGELADRQA
ncbi:hypothetical protein [Streptomyces sp. NPDC046182]|uniref:hypothetical protein n=1 Tax=Streptomyces sp. NPDC046182 TaxID=3154601 RepID=UPI0033DF2045